MVFVAGDICAMADSLLITIVTVLVIISWLITGIILKGYKPIYLSIFILYIMAYSLTQKELVPNQISSFIANETDGTAVEIVGIVEKIQNKETYTQIYLKKTMVTLLVNDELYSETNNYEKTKLCADGIILNVSEYQCSVGDTVLVTGVLKEFPTARNTGGFDSKLYYKTIGFEYRCTGKISEIIKKNENELLSILTVFKKSLKESYESISDEKDAGLYESIIIGDKEGLQEDINDLYKNNGIAHLLAISGMHISIIGMSLYKLLRKAGIRFLPCAVASIAVILCYGIMTGNGVSTMRAVIMFILVAGAGVFGRTYDILTATSLAAILILIESPTMLLNCGFLLSFGAILGMVVTAPAINQIFLSQNGDKKKSKRDVKKRCITNRENNSKNNYGTVEKEDFNTNREMDEKEFIKRQNRADNCRFAIDKSVKYLALSASMSFSVSLTTLPIILYFYFQIPIYSVLVNIIVVPLMALVMVSAVCGGIVGIMFQAGGIFFIGMAHYILAFYETVCIFFSKLPYALVIVGQPSIEQIILFYSLLTGFVWYMNHLKISGEQEIAKAQSKVKEKTQANPKVKFLVNSKVKTQANPKAKYIRKCRYAALAIPIMILVLCFRKQEGLNISMIDVGQGDSIFVRSPSGTTYLFDGGSSDIKNVGKFRIVPFIKASGMDTIDYIIVSHMDRDHINGIRELIDDESCFGLKIKYVVLPEIKNKDEDYIELENAITKKKISIIYVSVGDLIGESCEKLYGESYGESYGDVSGDKSAKSSAESDEDSLIIKCLHPSENYVFTSTNGYSMTVSLHYRNFDMLFTGDLENEGENLLLASNLLKDYDVLKVAHHGSMYSSQEKFLSVVKPEISLISCGIGNSFGHPHPQLLSRLKNITGIKSNVFITAECGEIKIYTDGYSVEAKRFRKTNIP